MKGIVGDCAASIAYGVCGLVEINRLFDGAADYQGSAFADHLLENMNITIEVAPEQFNNIPKEGGFIMVSNHPFGGIEGVMLLSAICKVRPDFKLMANFILSHIPNLKECFLSRKTPSGKAVSEASKALSNTWPTERAWACFLRVRCRATMAMTILRTCLGAIPLPVSSKMPACP